MRPTVDVEHNELKSILEILLAEDIDITAREVARRHSVLKHATAFTKNSSRAELVQKAKEGLHNTR